jgi:ElaB/YqjD/DUF883 family membrane-anchored ribosome-binding protein
MEHSSLSENKPKRKWIYILLVVIVGLVVFLILKDIKEKKQDVIRMQYIEAKNALRDDLDDLIDEHDDLLDEYSELNDQLHEKDSIIQNQIAEIRNLIRTKSDLSEARKKIIALKEISKRYLANIDSLLVVNEQLGIEKDSVIKVNKNINWKNYKLNKQNEKLTEKVNRGSVLEILDVDVEAVRYRGTGREVSTRKAKKIQKLRVCFTIGANQISDAEEKIVFMQLLSSSGDIISEDEDLLVKVNDEDVNYTTSTSFEYENIEMTSCFEWERVQQLKRDIYLINLIIEGRIIGQAELKLK